MPPRSRFAGRTRPRRGSVVTLKPTLSMFDFKPDELRENEFLWGDRRGYEYVKRPGLKKPRGDT